LRPVFFARPARVLVRPYRGRFHQQRVQGLVLLHGSHNVDVLKRIVTFIDSIKVTKSEALFVK
jgi:hypothetical protein